MKLRIRCPQIFFMILILSLIVGPISYSQESSQALENSNTLVVIWSSDDPKVAFNVCLMYTHAARKNNWFERVLLVVWGPSAKLLGEHPELQTKIKAMQQDGVITQACIVCANNF